MAICYMDEERYDCTYEINDYGIRVEFKYDIFDEISPDGNGVRTFGTDTTFRERNMLIIDNAEKINYLLIDARFDGTSKVFGGWDSGCKTRFFANNYYYGSNCEKLNSLTKDSKISKIRIYSKLISELIGYQCLKRNDNKEEYVITLNKNSLKKELDLNKNNIKKIIMSDEWNLYREKGKTEIKIDINSFIEIDLKDYITINEVYSYVHELQMYFQLYIPSKFKIDKIMVEVENNYFGIFNMTKDFKYKEKNQEKSININIIDFLLNCYEKIPYRDSKEEIRNIPYIVLETSRGLEDNFLMFYRFIECFYKKKGIKSTFIEYSLNNNYNLEKIKEYNIEDFVYEVVSLRNHYVHEGYYLKNNHLFIKYPKINNKSNPKNHRINYADVDWIYDKTKVLYDICIDIIFRNMLGYKAYKFNKHF